MGEGHSDDVLDTLEALAEGLQENITRLELALERTARIRELRRSGMTYSEIVEHSERPLIVEILTTNLLALQQLGHRLRGEEARALHAEGLSVNRIAELFGVSRQRVMALLRSAPSA